MKKKWLYIPIETKVRELHGKTLLACFAAINGFSVVIGSKKDITSGSLLFPKGTIFNIGLAKNLAKNAKRYKKYGHRVAAIDEEGIVTLNDDLYLRHRISRETLDVTDMFFCWGKKQASLVENEASKTNCKMFITGNPRFDMLRPEYKVVFNNDVEEIKKRYGKFILVNTNFGHGNHFSGDDFLIESFKEKGWMDDSRDKDFFLRNIEWQKEMLNKFSEMIPELSKSFGDCNVIIRPHPSENHDFWRKIAENYPNVSVVHSGNVIPWIMAADVLIHNGCTTAVEAFLLGTKVIAYRPFVVNDQETELPNKISMEAHNINELLDVLSKIIINQAYEDRGADKMAHLDSYLVGIRGKTASETIVSNLSSNLDIAHGGIGRASLLYFKVFECIKRIIRKILLDGNISESYQLHKMASLSKGELGETIKEFSKIDERFINLEIKKIGETCYNIYEKK